MPALRIVAGTESRSLFCEVPQTSPPWTKIRLRSGCASRHQPSKDKVFWEVEATLFPRLIPLSQARLYVVDALV